MQSHRDRSGRRAATRASLFEVDAPTTGLSMTQEFAPGFRRPDRKPAVELHLLGRAARSSIGRPEPTDRGGFERLLAGIAASY